VSVARRIVAAGVLLAAAACRGEPAAPGRARAAVARRADTIRFAAPATAYRCAAGDGVVLEAIELGNGLLVWVRTRDSVAGSYQILGVRDTVTPRGALVAVRFMAQAAAQGLSLDSGGVTVRDASGRLALTVAGSGLDLSGGARLFVEADIDSVPLPAAGDSIPCAAGS
jgi:hypothetical protein